jgi:L-lactate dehydrogenase complex protein LldG
MTSDTTASDPERTLDAFRASLEEADVTSDVVPEGSVTAAVERAVDPPAVGVDLHVDAALPEDVETEFSPSTLRAARTGVTPASLGVASVGSVLVRSSERSDELVSLYPSQHVAVVHAADVVADLPAATTWLASEVDAGRDSYVFATGASATADMGALVEGVHGPTDVHVVVVDSERDAPQPDAVRNDDEATRGGASDSRTDDGTVSNA